MPILLSLAGALLLALITLAVFGPRVMALAVALALASCASAVAQTAAAPSWGLWDAIGPAINQGASWLVGVALSAIGALFYGICRHALPAVIEARLRQTMLSGAHLLVLEAEEAAERTWTPERRRALVGQVVAYAMDRMPWAAARLKLTQRAVTGMAVKMLDQVLAGRFGSSVPPGLAGLPLSLPGAALAAPAPTACPTCSASDPERLARGCTADGCPLVPPADGPAAGLAAAAGAALSLPGLMLGAGLVPTG